MRRSLDLRQSNGTRDSIENETSPGDERKYVEMNRILNEKLS
jgi:hypothetical protein